MTEQEETDLMYEHYLNSQPDKTDDELKKELDDSLKCADYIIKHNITPNLDFPELD